MPACPTFTLHVERRARTSRSGFNPMRARQRAVIVGSSGLFLAAVTLATRPNRTTRLELTQPITVDP